MILSASRKCVQFIPLYNSAPILVSVRVIKSRQSEKSCNLRHSAIGSSSLSRDYVRPIQTKVSLHKKEEDI